MFKIIKKKYYKKAITAALAKRDVSQLNAKMHTIAFLYDGDQVNEVSAYHKIARSLFVSESKTQFFSFVTFQKNTPSLLRDQFSEKDISFKGRIIGDSAKEFVATCIDVLIFMLDKEHLHLDTVVAQSRAKFKVGFKGADPRFFDLILSVDPNDTAAVITELTKYLKILGKTQS
tara:strand:- start:26882 stop:27403 length:522 start_codon:yes stop_codon:yes gene_type:complete